MLEVVEVEDGQREIAAVAPRAADLLGEALLEDAAVHQAGERVGGGAPRQLGARLGVADRERDEVGEAREALGGRGRQGRGGVGGDHDGAPEATPHAHRSGDAAAEGVAVRAPRARRRRRPGSRRRARRGRCAASCAGDSGLVSGTVSSRGGQEPGRADQRPTKAASPSSNRTTAPPATRWTRASSRATLSKTSSGDDSRATATAMRRSAACSKAVRRREPCRQARTRTSRSGARDGHAHVVVGPDLVGGQHARARRPRARSRSRPGPSPSRPASPTPGSARPPRSARRNRPARPRSGGRPRWPGPTGGLARPRRPGGRHAREGRGRHAARMASPWTTRIRAAVPGGPGGSHPCPSGVGLRSAGLEGT